MSPTFEKKRERKEKKRKEREKKEIPFVWGRKKEKIKKKKKKILFLLFTVLPQGKFLLFTVSPLTYFSLPFYSPTKLRRLRISFIYIILIIASPLIHHLADLRIYIILIIASQLHHLIIFKHLSITSSVPHSIKIPLQSSIKSSSVNHFSTYHHL